MWSNMGLKGCTLCWRSHRVTDESLREAEKERERERERERKRERVGYTGSGTALPQGRTPNLGHNYTEASPFFVRLAPRLHIHSPAFEIIII